jgi:pimeloyl-ACP methyl ester carboxylesterase
MHKVFFKTFSLFLLLITVPLYGQDITEMAGHWTGYVEMNEQQVRIEITFSYSDNILDGTIDIPNRGTFTIPIEVVEKNNNQFVFQYETGHGPAVFYGSVSSSGNIISGDFEESGEVFPFTLNKSSTSNGVYTNLPETEITIPSSNAEIAGSLIKRAEPSPLVILVSGSGGEDRNQDISGFQTFQRLSGRLYEEGYSSFRYDDPGVGGSTGNADVTLQEMAAILGDIIQYMRMEYSADITGIVLLGYNQGGLVASIAANETNEVDGVILAATPFVSGDENITQQIQKISDVKDVPEEIVQRNLAFQEKIYNVVREEGDWSPIEGELGTRLRSQIEELPLEHQNALGDMNAFIQSQIDRQLETAKSRWFKSWIETDPISVFEKLKVPVLAVFGEKDTQVLPQPNSAKADSLASAADLFLQTVVLPEANHLFQKANNGMPTEYGMLRKEFTASFISEIDQYLSSLQFVKPD